MTWGTPKFYADYYKLLLTHSGRRDFKGWLERENPDLYQRFAKEVAAYESALDRKRGAHAKGDATTSLGGGTNGETDADRGLGAEED